MSIVYCGAHDIDNIGQLYKTLYPRQTQVR